MFIENSIKMKKSLQIMRVVYFKVVGPIEVCFNQTKTKPTEEVSGN